MPWYEITWHDPNGSKDWTSRHFYRDEQQAMRMAERMASANKRPVKVRRTNPSGKRRIAPTQGE
jgi:hypothetical protein